MKNLGTKILVIVNIFENFTGRSIVESVVGIAIVSSHFTVSIVSSLVKIGAVHRLMFSRAIYSWIYNTPAIPADEAPYLPQTLHMISC